MSRIVAQTDTGKNKGTSFFFFHGVPPSLIKLDPSHITCFNRPSMQYITEKIRHDMWKVIYVLLTVFLTPPQLTYPFTARVVGVPQVTSLPVSSICFCSPLPSGTWRSPGLSIPWCYLPTPFSVCLVFFPFLLCLAIWCWPDLMNGRHDHTTALCVSVRWSGLHVVRLPAGSWHVLPRWWYGLCMRRVISCGGTSFSWLVFFFGALLWGSMIYKHRGRRMWLGSVSDVSWNREKYSCHSKLVSTLSVLPMHDNNLN